MANGRPGNPSWVKGVSGNPSGRPRMVADIQALARAHTTEALRTLVDCLRDPKHKVAAATALLDRGWGRPVQAISGGQDAPPLAIHYTVEWASALPEPETTPAIDAANTSDASNADDADGEIRVVWPSC
jgi:hypothetical protein